MTGDQRFADWARRIADAYIEEVIPGSHGVLSGKWDFTTHTGDQRLRLRDHGNELIVGLVLQYANEQRWKTPRAREMAAGDRDAARSRARSPRIPTGCSTTRSTRPPEAVDATALGQLGLHLRRRLHLLPVHGRDALSRRGAEGAAQPAEVPAVCLGAASARAAAAAGIVRRLRRHASRARSISSRASRCPKRSTGSNRRCR